MLSQRLPENDADAGLCCPIHFHEIILSCDVLISVPREYSLLNRERSMATKNWKSVLRCIAIVSICANIVGVAFPLSQQDCGYDSYGDSCGAFISWDFI